MESLSQYMQYIVSGLTVGSIYAIFALSFNAIYNVSGIFNIAQGEFGVLGAMFAISLLSFGLSMPLVVIISILLVAAIGMLFERFLVRPVRRQRIIVAVLVTVGAQVFLSGSAGLIWGRDDLGLRALTGEGVVHFLGAVVSIQALWIIGATVAIALLLRLFFGRTLLGKAMRACHDDSVGACISGIDPKRMVNVGFAVSGGLGALAGILITPITTINNSSGIYYAFKGLAAATLGGLGSNIGAFAGGYLLGLSEQVTAGVFSSLFKDGISFLILIVVLVFRPRGLFGEPSRESSG